MLKKLLRHKINVLLVIGLVLLLVAVRAFEEPLFYDPFGAYFKSDYLNKPFPKFDELHLFLSMGFRYLLNTLLSLVIIYLLLRDRILTQFAAVLYAILFTILIVAFFIIVTFSDQHNNFVLFYIRRFLIQPLFLIIMLPAFFYQRQSTKK